MNVQKPAGKSHDWIFLSPTARSARVKLSERSESLPYFANIYQGIRTGANDIFIVTIESLGSGPLVHVRNGLGDIDIIETDILRPIVMGSEVQRYSFARPNRYLIYPYKSNHALLEQEFQELFPQALNYLLNYRNLLAERTTVVVEGKSWFELQRPRDESWLGQKKLMTRDLATETSFALDDEGSTYLIGGNAIIPSDEQFMLPLLGYLNSKLANWVLSQITPSFQAGFQKFETQHLLSLPVLKEIFDDVYIRNILADLVKAILESKLSDNSRLQNQLEAEIDSLLCEVAGIDLQEIQ